VANLQTVSRFTAPWDAHIAQGRLQAEELVSWIVDEHYIWANWMYSFVLGQVKLQVLALRLSLRARSLQV
jgi:hypothetical protein